MYCFKSDNSYLLSGSYDSTIKLWDVNSGECIYTFTGHKDAVNTVTFNPDGTTLPVAQVIKPFRFGK